MLDAWLRIDPNGTVTIFTGKIELGQGIGTALSQIAADELDVHLERIEVIQRRHRADAERGPDRRQRFRSSRAAPRCASRCAEARDILVSTAAAKLGAPAADLKVSDGTIAAPGGASATYWEPGARAPISRARRPRR